MSGLPEPVRQFLEEIGGTEDIEYLRSEVELWENSSDLNEKWIAKRTLRARELLIEFGGKS